MKHDLAVFVVGAAFGAAVTAARGRLWMAALVLCGKAEAISAINAGSPAER